MSRLAFAVVEEVNPDFVRVRYGTGITDVEFLSGINKPKGIAVGDYGELFYNSTASSGLWFFDKKGNSIE